MTNFAAVFKSLIICGVSPGSFGATPANTQPCSWIHLVALARTLIDDLVVISTLLATAVFFYIGFTLLTSGGSPGAKDKAKHAAISLVKGYLCIIAAWLVVYTISSALLNPGFSLLS